MNSRGKIKVAKSILSVVCFTALGADPAIATDGAKSSATSSKTNPPAKANAQTPSTKAPVTAAAKPPADREALRAASLHLKRANGFQSAVEPELAIAEYNTALKLVPGMPEALKGRGMAYVDLEKYPEALADLELVASTSNSETANAMKEAGTVNFKIKHYDAAIVDFDRFGKNTNQKLLATTYVAECYLSMNKFDQALKVINIAYKLADGNDLQQNACRRLRAKIYCGLGQYQKAVDDYTTVIAYLVKHHDSGEVLLSSSLLRPDVILERAKAYDHLGKPDLAKKDREGLRSESSFYFKNSPFRIK